jgi:hypothetical protein
MASKAKLIGCALVFAGVVIGCAALWDRGPGPMIEQHRWAARVEAKLWELRSKRPPNIARGSWAFLVGWTINLSANCSAVRREGVTSRDNEQFLQELERKLEEGPEFETIDWIWDEYIRLTKGGQHYDRYRPTRPEAGWETASVGCFGWPVD